jgi:hypothetical protein
MPHTQTTLDFTACAFTEKVRKFCIMMKNMGHTVYLYSGDQNEAPCDEHIQCFNEGDRLAVVGEGHYTQASFDYRLPHWIAFNARVGSEIQKRKEPQDFICVMGGLANKQIADMHPEMMTVEFGIGYGGVFAKYKVFESYAWMHTVYGSLAGSPNAADGAFFDDVIPAYIEPELFPFVETPSDYLLFMGRLIERKGYEIALQVAKYMKKEFIVAGQGRYPTYGIYKGVVGPKERAELFGNAMVSFAPTIYVEPFGTVVIESQMCGTPTLTTDWGAFTETVTNGFNGYRCRTFKQFVEAVDKSQYLDRKAIHDNAMNKYSLQAIQVRYDEYFKRLLTLWEDGWYSMRP